MRAYDNYKLKESVSNRKPKKHSVAFFERGSWYHRTKSIDGNGKIKYGKKGGFASQKEAEENYWRCLEEFEKSCLSMAERNSGTVVRPMADLAVRHMHLISTKHYSEIMVCRTSGFTIYVTHMLQCCSVRN